MLNEKYYHCMKSINFHDIGYFFNKFHSELVILEDFKVSVQDEEIIFWFGYLKEGSLKLKSFQNIDNKYDRYDRLFRPKFDISKK